MRRLGVFLGFLTLAAPCAAAAQDYPARVAVYAAHQGGNVMYHYDVRNNGPAEIRRFFIGCDCRSLLNAIPELQVLPLGAAVQRTDDFGSRFRLAPDATRQPAGWRARVVQPAGASGYWVEWYMPAARPNAGIAAGQSLGGFTVVIPGADDAYLSGQYTVVPEGAISAVSAPLALLDTEAPTLSLEARAAPIEEGAAVRVVATAKDDRDPEPRIVVESMGRADTPGAPAYAIVYSATDASGNRTTASAQVRLPAAAGAGAPRAPAPPVRPKPVTLPRVAFLP